MSWALINLCEKIIALVVNQNEGGKIFYSNLPNGFHAKFGEIDHLLAFDMFFGE